MELLKEIYNTNDVEVQVGAASTKAATGNVQLNKYVISVTLTKPNHVLAATCFGCHNLLHVSIS